MVRMDVKVIESKKDSMIVEIAGEDHTLGNAVRDNLWKEKGIDAAAYRIDHPLKCNLQIKAEGSKPQELLAKASRALEQDAKEFKKKFSAAVK